MNRDNAGPNDLLGREVREAIAPALSESPANLTHYILIGVLPDNSIKVARNGALTDELADRILLTLLADRP